MITAVRIASRLFAVLLVVVTSLPAVAAEPKVKMVAFGLFGDQDVFESEAKGAAQIMAGRLGAAPAVVRFNSKTREDATPDTLATTLQSTAMGMDAEGDVFVVILTSHGSPAGVAVKTPSRQGVLAPLDLFTMLDATHVRHRIVIVSACYSGVFIPPLADPDTLVITAADADHPSFGCRNGAAWTYFGDAFFNMALRRTSKLARGVCVGERRHPQARVARAPDAFQSADRRRRECRAYPRWHAAIRRADATGWAICSRSCGAGRGLWRKTRLQPRHGRVR
jgi:hypothetical protein